MVWRKIESFLFVESEPGRFASGDALLRPWADFHGGAARRGGIMIPVDDGQAPSGLEDAECFLHQGYRLLMVEDIEKERRIHGIGGKARPLRHEVAHRGPDVADPCQMALFPDRFHHRGLDIQGVNKFLSPVVPQSG